jgi:hypothetical protein
LDFALQKFDGKMSRTQVENVKAHCRAGLRSASACSGTDVCVLANEKVQDKYGPEDVQARHFYSCEKKASKVQFMRTVTHRGHSCLCIFSNLDQLKNAKADCFVHEERQCPIPSGLAGPDVMPIGVSCKSLSKLFVNHKDYTNCIAQAKGSTGETTAMMVEFARALELSAHIHAPRLVPLLSCCLC